MARGKILNMNQLSIRHRPKSFMSKPATTLASIVLFLYILPNPSITITTYLTNNNNNNNHNHSSSSSSNSIDNIGRSLTIGGLVSASPIPEPTPALRATKSSSTHRIPPINGSIFGKRSVGKTRNREEIGPKNQYRLIQQSYSSDFSKARNYRDIITDLIEDFLALNNEDDPERTTVAFCKVVVYECMQVLSKHHRDKPLQRLVI